MMITDWMRMTSIACSSRPAIIELRRAGDTRKRSTTPRLMSSIIPIPPQPAENSAVITTTPGVRNWM